MPLGSGHLITKEPDNGLDERIPLAPYGGMSVTVEVMVPTGIIWKALNVGPLLRFNEVTV